MLVSKAPSRRLLNMTSTALVRNPSPRLRLPWPLRKSSSVSPKKKISTSLRVPDIRIKKQSAFKSLAPTGKPAGELSLVIEAKPGPDGKMYEKTVERPQSTLHYLEMGPEDFQSLARMPAYPLTTAQLAKYDLKYLGKELVDEVDCYIFQAKPKTVERAHFYFDGIVWVDAAYLEVVKTYGKWVNDMGDMRSATMPFNIFETYRENVDGKYWLPNYMRSDDTLNLKDANIPVRLVIKWTEYKLPSAATPVPAAAPAVPSTPSKPNS